MSIKPNFHSSKIISTTYLIFILLLEGASVMFVELAAARMISPYYGATLTTWAAVLGVTMSSLALGYLIGGKFADKSKNPVDLLQVILFLCSLAVLLIPYWANYFMFRFSGLPLLANILLLTFVILFVPLLLFGAIPQIVIKILSSYPETTGKVAGFAYAISTIGGIAGTLITGFFIIPAFGISFPVIATGIIIFAFPCYSLLIKQKKWSLLLFVPVLLVVVKNSYKSSNFESNIIVRSFEEGLLGQIMVADFPVKDSAQHTRLLMINRMPETSMDVQTLEPALSDYVSIIMHATVPVGEGSDVLLLGLGGGNLVKACNKRNYNMDVCELDSRIADAAFGFFNLADDFHLEIDDARHYLRKIDKKYDLIIFDLFKGETPPAYLLSKENIKSMENLLNPGGIIAVNFTGFITGDIGKGGRSILKTMMLSDFRVKLFTTNTSEAFRNSIFILSKTDYDYSKTALCPGSNTRLNNHTKINNLSELQYNITTIDTADAHLLTDDKPLLDILNDKAAKSWRYNYNRYYTNTFVREGIPMFK